MKTPPQCRSHPSGYQRVAGWLAFAGLLALTILTASPEIHRFLHADAGNPDHVCSVTLAKLGFCDTTPAILLPETPAPLFQPAPDRAKTIRWSAPAFWHPPSHGPPVDEA